MIWEICIIVALLISWPVIVGWKRWVQRRQEARQEKAKRRQELVDFYKERGEVMPVCIYAYITGTMSFYDVPPRELIEEFRRIRLCKDREAGAKRETTGVDFPAPVVTG